MNGVATGVGVVFSGGKAYMPHSGGMVGGLSVPGANTARLGGAGSAYHTQYYGRDVVIGRAPIYVEPGTGGGDGGGAGGGGGGVCIGCTGGGGTGGGAGGGGGGETLPDPRPYHGAATPTVDPTTIPHIPTLAEILAMFGTQDLLNSEPTVLFGSNPTMPAGDSTRGLVAVALIAGLGIVAYVVYRKVNR